VILSSFFFFLQIVVNSPAGVLILFFVKEGAKVSKIALLCLPSALSGILFLFQKCGPVIMPSCSWQSFSALVSKYVCLLCLLSGERGCYE
jgi:hypothetical protein